MSQKICRPVQCCTLLYLKHVSLLKTLPNMEFRKDPLFVFGLGWTPNASSNANLTSELKHKRGISPLVKISVESYENVARFNQLLQFRLLLAGQPKIWEGSRRERPMAAWLFDRLYRWHFLQFLYGLPRYRILKSGFLLCPPWSAYQGPEIRTPPIQDWT